jgi:hypothetical protein
MMMTHSFVTLKMKQNLLSIQENIVLMLSDVTLMRKAKAVTRRL